MANILIIDDDEFIRDILAENTLELGHLPVRASTLAAGVDIARTQPIDLVFLDVHLPDGNGLRSLSAIRQAPSNPEVIIITGQGEAEGAKMAINSGAWDYLPKPIAQQDIVLQIKRAIEYRDKAAGVQTVALKREAIIGSSAVLDKILDQVAQCAASDANVLITGETGTGKELFARTIHSNSSYGDGQLVVVDCAALPEQLVESILFGHEKGAYTGADQAKTGLIQQAHGGTLFLDEVGEMPLTTQKAFLRVLQEHRFRPVGSTQEQSSRFRLIAATNQDLDQLVHAGKFRQDLLFRLKTFAIHLPPLRVRPDDVRELTMHYIHRLCEHHGMEHKGIIPELFEILEKYHWPGNTRELINTLETAVLADPGNPVLYAVHLPEELRVHYAQSQVHHQNGPPSAHSNNKEKALNVPYALLEELPDYRSFHIYTQAACEKQYFRNLLSVTQKNIQKACARSGLSRARLYALLKKHGLTQPKGHRESS